jgi:hypothetical protein
VIIAKWHPQGLDQKAATGQLIEDELGEMHVCIGEQCADFTASDSDIGTLTFTKGGPMGGYWKFKKDGIE